MAVVFDKGQTLTKNDLNIFIKDANAALFDPNFIYFNVEDLDGNSILTQRNIIPQKESTGWYWADIIIPTEIAYGSYVVKWAVQDTPDSSFQEYTQKFSIVTTPTQVIYTPTIGGVAYYPGQSLTEKDLYIMVKNHMGNLVNPFKIYYEIFQRMSGVEILISPMQQVPLQLGIGHYFANFQIPTDSFPGDYFIKWTFQETPTGEENSAVQEFAVISSNVIVQDTYTEPAKKLIRKLRFILRDNNPDRNYHFMPPASEETVQGFTQKFGYVWEDEELYEYVDIAISDLNNHPPHESWLVDTLPARLYAMILSLAGAIALRALAINWSHDEWSGDLSGVSLNLEKSSKYMALKENFEQEYQRQLTEHKEYGVRVIVGIRQPRYGIGVSSALGPYNKVGMQSRRNYLSSERSSFY